MKTHDCRHGWVQCDVCLPILGKRTGQGLDEYGNRCHACNGRGVVPRCAQCEVEISRARFRKDPQ